MYFFSGGSGETTFVSKRYLARGGEVSEGVTIVVLKSTYFWRPVEDTDFTVGIVVAIDDKSETLGQQSIPSGLELIKINFNLFFSCFLKKFRVVQCNCMKKTTVWNS